MQSTVAEAITLEHSVTSTTGSPAFDFHFEVDNSTTLKNPKSPNFNNAKATPGNFPANNTADFTGPIPATGIPNTATIKFSWTSGLLETNSILDAFWTDQNVQKLGASVKPTRVDWHFLNNPDGTVTLDIFSPDSVGFSSVEFWTGLSEANLEGPNFFDLQGPLPGATQIFSDGSGAVGERGQILAITYLPSGLNYDVFRMVTSTDVVAIAFNSEIHEPPSALLLLSALLVLYVAHGRRSRTRCRCTKSG